MVKEAKKEEHSKVNTNSYGVASVILGILSIVFASVNGIILAIIGLVFAYKQSKHHENNWSKAGRILSIIGIVVSLLAIAVSVWYLRNFANLGDMYALQ